jgi:hypothetical protein
MELNSQLEQEIALSTIRHVRQAAHAQYSKQRSPILESVCTLPVHHLPDQSECVYSACIRARQMISQHLRMQYVPLCPFTREHEQYGSPILYRSSCWHLFWDYPTINVEDKDSTWSESRGSANSRCDFSKSKSVDSNGNICIVRSLAHENDGLGDALVVSVDTTRTHITSWVSSYKNDIQWSMTWHPVSHQILCVSYQPHIPQIVWNEQGIIQSIGDVRIIETCSDKDTLASTDNGTLACAHETFKDTLHDKDDKKESKYVSKSKGYEYWPEGRLYPLIRLQPKSVVTTSLLEPLRIHTNKTV